MSQEGIFDVLYECHVEKLGHAASEKMAKNLAKKYENISRNMCDVFYKLCPTCALNKKVPGKAEAIRPIISTTFNSRGQVDLIDMQAIPIRCFKWILHYQDHLTKFSYLRAIINKTAVCVAQELLDIFLMQGCPCILQSDNGREFVNSVIRELMTLWPAAKIVNGRARHPQSQGSVERSNQDVELMLGAMMKDLGTSDWPMCLPFIAHQKNNRFHKGIDAIPYEVQYGSKCKIGLADCLLPTWFFNEDVMNEEDLERVLHISESSNNISESLNNVSHSSTDEPNDEVLPENTTCCCGCGTSVVGSKHRCSITKKLMFGPCLAPGEEEGRTYGGPCNRCAKAMDEDEVPFSPQDTPNRGNKRRQANEAQRKQAEAMKKQRARGHEPVIVGTIVLVQVAAPDRNKTDSHYIPGIVVEVTDNQFCRIACKGGVLKTCYARETLRVEANVTPELYRLQGLTDTWKALPKISVREALTHISPTGGQGYVKCGCKGECKMSNCKCFKAGVLCNSRCHGGSATCKNCN